MDPKSEVKKWISLRILFSKWSKMPIIGIFDAYGIKLVKAPGRGGVINGQLKTLVKSSNVPLFGAMVLHVFVNSINPNSVTIDKLYQK